MDVFFPFEMIGTVAFAISGAMVGIEKKMDIFGVAILGLTTAVGGGILRDLILGITPPAAFRQPMFALTAIVVSILVFLPYLRKVAEHNQRKYDLMLLIMDSIGLGLFTVTGIQIAKTQSIGMNDFLITFVGVLTGVGGGILRDVFAGNMPHVFVKHFYACASILGAWTCVLLWRFTGEFLAMLAGAAVTFVLRILAAHYRWSLPRAR
ncbi:MAG: trimeric intracellular cation channel family protein [Blautia sp.]|nr:trimeric intracellular cation channel family protein [Blautia sp.]